NNISKFLAGSAINPEIIIEPTCGKGNFIVSTLRYFTGIKEIIGIEIYKPYVWECKFNIIEFYLTTNSVNKPDITIVHSSIFDFDFTSLAERISNRELLIIGNPPWVTNSKLGSINSTNLPQKSNFKKNRGLDALTGKSNFDITEYIIT